MVLALGSARSFSLELMVSMYRKRQNYLSFLGFLFYCHVLGRHLGTTIYIIGYLLFYCLPMWANVQLRNEIFMVVHFNATSVYLQ